MIDDKSIKKAGFKPVNLVVLHDAGVILKPMSSNEEPWWKEYPEEGKHFLIDGRWLKDLANMLGIETYPLECKGKSKRTLYQKLSTMDIPIGSLAIQENPHDYPIKKLWAKVDNGVLHLAAITEDEESFRSTHGGGFDIAWDMHPGRGEI